ncbi:MAG: PPOX class F420-dependent oxidoreductase [Actinomycetota bacterium]|nr:PPOX class F420-dependent oxidoreductase [Actinomycetota bacterium]
MSLFTDAELHYLTSERLLARLATVGEDGTPHIAPVGWSFAADNEVIEIGGHSFEKTKKYRDIERHGRAAIVIDDVLPPWRPRGIEIRGRAEAIQGSEPRIRLYPERIVSWGLDEGGRDRNARNV